MSSLVRNFSWGSIGSIVSTALRAITLALLARLTLPADFAVYATIFGVLAVGKAIADLGLTKFIMRDRALASVVHANKEGNLYPHALKLNGLSSIALGLVAFGSILGTWGMGMVVAIQLLPLAVSAGLEKSADVWRALHTADGKTHLRAVDLMIRRMVSLVLFSLLALTGTLPPIVSLALSEAVAAAVSLLAVRLHFYKEVIVPRKMKLKPVIESARPFWINTLAMSSRNLDVAIVSGVSPLTESGYFAAAARLVGPLQVVPSSLATVVLPHVARADNSNGGAAARLPIYASLLSFPLCSLLSMLAVPLTPYVLGDTYTDAIPSIQLIILGTPLAVYYNLMISVLQGQGYAKQVSRISLMFPVILIPAVALGAYFGGATGAAFGTICANAMLAVLVHLVRRNAN